MFMVKFLLELTNVHLSFCVSERWEKRNLGFVWRNQIESSAANPFVWRNFVCCDRTWNRELYPRGKPINYKKCSHVVQECKMLEPLTINRLKLDLLGRELVGNEFSAQPPRPVPFHLDKRKRNKNFLHLKQSISQSEKSVSFWSGPETQLWLFVCGRKVLQLLSPGQRGRESSLASCPGPSRNSSKVVVF